MFDTLIDTRPTSTANPFRRARVDRLLKMATRIADANGVCRILDLGGTAAFWDTWAERVDWARIRITCVNLPGHAKPPVDVPVTMIDGDARALPDIATGAFDLCFSNSVIEHVGRWPEMTAMASEVRRIAPSYLVQTPNFWFPVEPHARTPFLHWLPEPVAARLVMARRRGYWERRATMDAAMRAVQSARLIGPAQMAALFPDATIRRERFLGFTKSLLAIRSVPA